jgi:hypothetical protein
MGQHPSVPAALNALEAVHRVSNLNDLTHSDYGPNKERTQLRPTNMAHVLPPAWASVRYTDRGRKSGDRKREDAS